MNDDDSTAIRLLALFFGYGVVFKDCVDYVHISIAMVQVDCAARPCAVIIVEMGVFDVIKLVNYINQGKKVCSIGTFVESEFAVFEIKDSALFRI